MKRQSLLTAAVAAACFVGSAHATNWFQLQGTEPSGIAAPFHLFGFIQPTYEDTGGTAVTGLGGAAKPFNNAVPKFNEVAPQDTSMSSFNMLRARIAVRGTVTPISNKIDYFIMAEFGNNGYTYSNGSYTPRLTDASVTFNEIPGMRVRVGLFKTPGPEEVLQGIPDFDYINFTNVSAQLILNQFIGSAPAIATGPGAYAVQAAPINAGRDQGIQLFDWFNNGPWQFAYAAMVGNGAPLYYNAQSNSTSYYGRLQESYIFHHSKGPHQAGITAWVWGHLGHQSLNVGTVAADEPDAAGPDTEPVDGPASVATGGFTRQNYTFKRYGIGAQYRSGFMTPGALRVTGELMRGTGWILSPAAFSGAAAGFNGVPPTCGASPGANALCTETLYPGANNAAVGGYIETGFFVTKHWDLEARYDQYDRMTNNPGLERIFKTTTLGVQYYISPMARITLNYAFNRINVPHLSAIKGATPAATAIAQGNASAVASAKDNTIALQTTLFF
ncbi:porin family protein [Acidiferrobacter thiooxydans]|uniref:Porin n=1 Tax=Acidiferrobacter thiooxydans TaxID=163359 RepID=A0A368HJT2_9GAMM|nr:hypothetical protein [Acidiferrobacter thiooxydans]RCN58550.1 hypothetical protein C4900_01785 [Acidiferrobacter thiooxydans]